MNYCMSITSKIITHVPSIYLSLFFVPNLIFKTIIIVALVPVEQINGKASF